jgi:hypothetical protein
MTNEANTKWYCNHFQGIDKNGAYRFNKIDGKIRINTKFDDHQTELQDPKSDLQ